MTSNKKGGILSKVPLPDTFFSIKHQLRPIASISVSAPSAILIYLLAIGGFVACWVFYSAPGPPVTIKVTQQEWYKKGYECKPLQKDSHYGQLYSYDECLEKVRTPSNDNVEVSIGGLGACETITNDCLHSASYYPFASVPTIEAPIDELSCKNKNLGNSKADSKSLCLTQILNKWTADKVCKGFKENAPFQCSKTEVTYKSALEKLSLSIANTQLLFGVLTAFFAFMFYKCKKRPMITHDISKPWMEEIHRLREDLSRLRNDVDKSKKQVV
jgi:hypothetical protein